MKRNLTTHTLHKIYNVNTYVYIKYTMYKLLLHIILHDRLEKDANPKNHATWICWKYKLNILNRLDGTSKTSVYTCSHRKNNKCILQSLASYL